MYEIVNIKQLADKMVLMDVLAPRVAKYCQPGQFVIIRIDEKGERIPLTICDFNREKNTVTIVFQAVGATTEKMLKLKVGDYFQDFVGPLGTPAEFVDSDIHELKNKKYLFVAGGVGTAPVYPQVKWFNNLGIKADVIIGARNREALILTEEMKEVAGDLYIATDDGSLGEHGRVTDVIKKLVVDEGKSYDICVAIGPMIMMKFVCELTKELNIPTTVSMNPIMIDGTGMCGGCRVSVGDKVKFACVDGPEFDGHLVNFDEAMFRQSIYKEREQKDYAAMCKNIEDHSGGCCSKSLISTHEFVGGC